MERPRASTLLLIGLVLSMGLHVTVLLPALVSVMTAKVTGYDRVRAKFAPEDFEPTPTDKVQLGIERSEASTMTWIGYEDYQEHLARLAEVEQAQFQTEPTGAEPTPPVPVQPTPVQEVVDASAEARPLQDPRDSDQQTPPTAEEALKELETFAKAPDTGAGPPEGDPVNPLARQQALESEDPQQTAVKQPDETENPDRADQADPREASQQAQQETPPGKPGDQADKESDATSTVEVSMEQMTLGRPLAVQGLLVKPRKPVFTTLTLMTAAPGNPRAELRFRRDGRPVRVRLLESSGDPRIDEAVLNSLYRWRAAGAPLRELRRGQSMPIQIRILLGSR